MIIVTILDLGLKLSTGSSAEAVVLGYRAIPDQVSPNHDHDDGDGDDQNEYAENHGNDDDNHAPEEDSKMKSAQRGRVEENVTWAECVL